MQIVKTLLVIAVIILSVSFVMQNRWIIEQGYEVQYYGHKTPEIPVVLLLLGNIFLGALLVAVPSVIKNHRLKRTLKTEQKRIVQLERELNSLRNLPITEEKNLEQIKKNT